MSGYDAWKTTPPDVDCDDFEQCPHCGSEGPTCSQDCATQEEEAYDLYNDNACEVA